MAAILLWAGSGCGSDSKNGSGGSGGTAGSGQCQAPDTFQPGVEKTGTNGVRVTIIDATPATPVVGNNRWTVEVHDGSGATIDGAQVTLKQIMPAHEGHGSAVQAVSTPQGQGKYALDPVNFNMDGVWNITVKVSSGGLTDSVAFDFCVAG